MHQKIVELANDPPKLAISEWCRRVLAHHSDFPLPSLAEREQHNLRLDGEERRPNIVEQRKAGVPNGSAH